MKVSKDALSTARRIYRLCISEGTVDENHLRSAISKIVEQKPRNYRGILCTLHRLVRTEQARRHVIVESAQDLDAGTRQRIESQLTEQKGNSLTFQYLVEADLLGGIRIKLGDDVWDGSVKAKLERIANAF